MSYRKQLHQSGAEMLAKCGTQFERRYIYHDRRPPSTFMIAGTAVDEAVTTDLDHKIQHGTLVENVDDLCDVARDVVENYPDKDIEPDKDERGISIEQLLSNTKDKAVRFVKTHHAYLAPTIQPAETRRRFSVDMDQYLVARAENYYVQADRADTSFAKKTLQTQADLLTEAAAEGMDFVGEQDIVERFETYDPIEETTFKSIHIRDTKSSKKSPNPTICDESDQLTSYSMASQVLDGKIPDKVKLDYLVDLKGGTKSLTLDSTRSQEQIDTYLERLVKSIAVIKSGMFVPAPQSAWWCDERYCGYARTCPFYRKGKKTISISNDLTADLKKSLHLVQIQKEGLIK